MEDITVQELKTKIDNKEKFVFIDVREQNEYDMFNLGATLIPIGSFPNYIEDLDEYKDQEIILHCRSGQRSGVAKELLLRAGFTKPRNVLGGVLAWIDMEHKQ